MRAAQYDRYGSPDVLYVTDVPCPPVGDNEVLVRVRALSVNGSEVFTRAGTLRRFTGNSFPRAVGLDFVGDVEAVGGQVDAVSPGDCVWGLLPRGQYFRGGRGSAAEYVSVPPSKVATIPAGLDPVGAAAIVTTGATALIGLRDMARLRSGERLLVRGASGGLGTAVVQLGKAFGAHVSGLARAENLSRVKELGADEVYDYRTTDPRDLGKFDVVFDAVGTELRVYRRLVGRGGRMIAAAPDMNHMIHSAVVGLASVIHGGRRIRLFSASPESRLLGELRDIVSTGAIHPVIAGVRPLEEISEAHRALEMGGGVGKQIVLVS